MTCRQAQELLALGPDLPGEAHARGEALGDMNALRDHCATCPACAAEEASLRRLAALLQSAAPTLPNLETELLRRRARMMAALPARPPAASTRRLDWVWVALVAVAFALGGFGGWSARIRFLPAVVTAGSPYERVDAVTLSPAGDRIRIGFDRLQPQSLEAPPSDPRVRALLLSTLARSSNPGLRIDAVVALGRVAAAGGEQPAVRAALLDALRHDANPGVRLQAVAALQLLLRAGMATGVATGINDMLSALSAAAQTDDNQGVRGLAVDALAAAPAADATPRLLAMGESTSDPAIRMRCAAMLRQLNAGIPSGWMTDPGDAADYR